MIDVEDIGFVDRKDVISGRVLRNYNESFINVTAQAHQRAGFLSRFLKRVC